MYIHVFVLGPSAELHEFDLMLNAKIDELIEAIRNNDATLTPEDDRKLLLFHYADEKSINPETSHSTISEIFGKERPIKVAYMLDVHYLFDILSYGKDRTLLVDNKKVLLKKEETTQIDLRSAKFWVSCFLWNNFINKYTYFIHQPTEIKV